MSTAVQLAVTLAGWTGAIATVIAYGLVTAKRISPDSLLFQGLNIVGAGLLSVSASTYGAWPSAVVNVIWVAIGIFALRAILQHRTTVSVPLIDDAAPVEAAELASPVEMPELATPVEVTPELAAAVEAAVAPEVLRTPATPVGAPTSDALLEPAQGHGAQGHTSRRNSTHRTPVAV